MSKSSLAVGVALTHPTLQPAEIVRTAREAEALGCDALWTSESYGNDAVVPLTWAAAHTKDIRLGTAIMQIPARSPAMTAMTAMTLDLLSGGRFILGLGLSGPVVAEGWHGQPATKPLSRTREYVEVVRDVIARRPLDHPGEHYAVPLRRDDSERSSPPLKTFLPERPDIPIYIAALGPKNVRQSFEIADGIIPAFFSPEKWLDSLDGDVAACLPDGFAVAPLVRVVVGEDTDACRDAVRPEIALYVGGMGPPGANYYNDLACRYGFEREAQEIQERYLQGDRRGAAAAVSDELVDAVTLVGTPAHVTERLQPWKESPATTLLLQDPTPEVVHLVVEGLAS